MFVFCFTRKGAFALLYSMNSISASHEACFVYSRFNFHAIIMAPNQGKVKLKIMRVLFLLEQAAILFAVPRHGFLSFAGRRITYLHPVEARVKIVERVQTILAYRAYA